MDKDNRKTSDAVTMKAITELNQEAHEIICHIRDAARNGYITWAQRDELLRIVYQDVNGQLIFARETLYYWTGIDMSGDKPIAS